MAAQHYFGAYVCSSAARQILKTNLTIILSALETVDQTSKLKEINCRAATGGSQVNVLSGVWRLSARKYLKKICPSFSAPVKIEEQNVSG